MLLVLLACTPPKPAPADSAAPATTDTAPAVDPTPTGTTPTDPGTADPYGLTLAEHPTMASILVARWTQPTACDARLAFRVDDAWLHAPVRALPAGPADELVLGVPFAHDVHVRVEDDCTGPSATEVGRTGPLPRGVPVPTLVSSTPGLQDRAGYHLSSTETGGWPAIGWTTLVDRRARVVWAWRTQDQRLTLQAQPAADGDGLLIDENALWGTFDAGLSEVVRVDIEGTTLARYPTPGLHHPFTSLSDGTIAWGAVEDGAGGPLFGNESLELLAPDGIQRRLWSCADWLGDGADCASNSLRHDALTDVFLFSFYSDETVVEVDATTGTTLRSFGHAPGSYGFDPSDAAFWWQHSPHFTADRTLLVSTHDAAGTETLVREYAVDDAARTLRPVWSFGEGHGRFGATEGEAARLANGNILHNTGSLPIVREATHSGAVVWEVEWPSTGTLHRSTMLELEELYLLRH